MVPKDTQKVFASLEAEAAGRWMDGPLPREALSGPVWDPDTQSWAMRKFTRFYPALRFIVQQGTAHGAEPERPVDDFTGNGTNGGAALEEAVKLNTLDEVAQLVGAVDAAFPASAGWGDLNLFKVDMAKAYKQAPVHPDDRRELGSECTDAGDAIALAAELGVERHVEPVEARHALVERLAEIEADLIVHLGVQQPLQVGLERRGALGRAQRHRA